MTGKPTRFTIEAAKVSLSPFSLLTASKSVTVVTDAFGGKIALDFSRHPGQEGGPFRHRAVTRATSRRGTSRSSRKRSTWCWAAR